MIERISNQTSPSITKITPIEKVDPLERVNDLLDNTLLDNAPKKDKHSQKEVDKETMEEVVKGMNDFLQPVNTSIKFVLHDKLNDYYVTVVDDATHEVIKEIPSKKLLDTYASMMEFVGLLVDKKI